MRYARIIKAVTAEPWFMTPEGHAAIVRLLNSKLGDGDKDGAPLDAQRLGYKGEPLPSMTVANGVATIPIYGVLGRGLSPIEKSCGACDYRDVDRDLTEAQSREDVRAIVLDIDSPGGAVAGLEGLAHRIAEIHNGPKSKRVVAFT